MADKLTFNVRIFDVETDQEERKTQYSLSKINVDLSEHRSFKSAHADYTFQKERVDKKIESIMNMLVWALHHGKYIEFINTADDQE